MHRQSLSQVMQIVEINFSQCQARLIALNAGEQLAPRIDDASLAVAAHARGVCTDLIWGDDIAQIFHCPRPQQQFPMHRARGFGEGDGASRFPSRNATRRGIARENASQSKFPNPSCRRGRHACQCIARVKTSPSEQRVAALRSMLKRCRLR